MRGAESQPPSGYVFDSSSLIELEHSRNLRHLPTSGGSWIVVPSLVAREVSKKGTPLEAWLRHGRIARFVGPEDEDFLRLLRQPGVHDAECQALAMAYHRGLTLVAEEGPIRREARRLSVRCINAEEFMEEYMPRLPL